jgi:hypothetical protein
MAAALKKRGVPVGYLLFDVEQHGSEGPRTLGAHSTWSYISTRCWSCAPASGSDVFLWRAMGWLVAAKHRAHLLQVLRARQRQAKSPPWGLESHFHTLSGRGQGGITRVGHGPGAARAAWAGLVTEHYRDRREGTHDPITVCSRRRPLFRLTPQALPRSRQSCRNCPSHRRRVLSRSPNSRYSAWPRLIASSPSADRNP